MTAPKKIKNPNGKAIRVMTRVSNADYQIILRNALVSIPGENPRGKLGKYLREAALNYKPSKLVGPK